MPTAAGNSFLQTLETKFGKGLRKDYSDMSRIQQYLGGQLVDTRIKVRNSSIEAPAVNNLRMLLNDKQRCRVFKRVNSRSGLSRSEMTGWFGGRASVSAAKRQPNWRARLAVPASFEHPTYG